LNQFFLICVEYSSSDSMVVRGVLVMKAAAVTALGLIKFSYWWRDFML